MYEKVNITKHAVEEYLNDNPKSKNPENELRIIFGRLFKSLLKKKLDVWNTRDEKKMIGKGNDRIVFIQKGPNIHIITYYKYIPDTILVRKKKTLKKINTILNGKKERQFLNKQIRKQNRESRKIFLRIK